MATDSRVRTNTEDSRNPPAWQPALSCQPRRSCAYEELIVRSGFTLIDHALEDPKAGNRTVWLAPGIAAAVKVGLWHVCDMPTSSSNVRSQQYTGKHLPRLSSSQFDPKQTF
jgi:hypothetical protein